MIGISKNKKGISLIVLVITIIVMIILAAAIILSLNSSGIIGKANEAKSKSDTANAKHVVALAKAEWDLMTEGQQEAEENFRKYALKKLSEAGITEVSSEVGGIIDVNTEGTLAYLAEKGELKVGDYVQYSYTPGTYVAKANETGNSSDQTFNSASSGNVELTNWRVMNTDNGIIKLVSVLTEETQGKKADSSFPVISATRKLKLDGKAGFENASKILNEMCKSLYSGNFGTARSINVDDILDALDYEKTRYYTNKNGVKTAATENQKTLGDLESDTSLGLSLNGDIKLAGASKKEGIEINYRQIDGGLVTTNYSINGSAEQKKIYELHFKYALPAKNGDGVSYWLASTGNHIDFKNQIIKYRVYMISSHGLNGQWLYTSNGNSRGETEDETVFPFLVRPVVTLNSGLMIDTSVEGKDGLTPTTAWSIK